MATELKYPDGLAGDHAQEQRGFGAHASLASIVVLGALMALALTGLLAGARTPPQTVRTDAAVLELTVPRILRNGEFFEMDVAVTARAPIADATIALPPALWRDMTINTMIPAASEEEFKDGRFRFRYGALKPGETLSVKIDGQINPPLTWGTRGEVALNDGERALAAIPVRITVLP